MSQTLVVVVLHLRAQGLGEGDEHRLRSLVEHDDGELYFTYFIIIIFIEICCGAPQSVLTSAAQQKLKIKK